MACYHPLKGFILGFDFRRNKYSLKITSSEIDFIRVPYNFDMYDSKGSVSCHIGKPHSVIGYRTIEDFIDIPCGQCVGCRLEYSRQWAIRCMLESSLHDFNYFLTLTYSDKCPIENPTQHQLETHQSILNDINTFYTDSDGVEHPIMTLCKEHLQKFYKRLRKSLKDKGLPSFRYYSCGEYGSQNLRPHYHVIAFGLELPDLKFFKKSSSGFNLYTSKILSDAWPFGFVIVGDVSFESCAYVSRYVMKKQKGKNASYYENHNILPEFSNMSLKPGIAADYYQDNMVEIYSNDKVVLPGGRVVSPPRYFDKLYERDTTITVGPSEFGDYSVFDDYDLLDSLDLFSMDSIKDIRAFKGSQSMENKLARTNLSKSEYLVVEENNAISRTKKLVRPL